MITVAAIFTQSNGEPATGLTLAEIDIYLFRRAKADGAVTALWSGQNPTEEVGGGIYTRAYTGEDTNTYQYFAYAAYTGATVLDTNYSLQAGSDIDQAEIDAYLSAIHGAGPWGVSAGASLVVYTATVGGVATAGVYCRMTSDIAGALNVDAGYSNALGQVTFHHDLPSGTPVYIWRTLAGVSFTDPDTEIIP